MSTLFKLFLETLGIAITIFITFLLSNDGYVINARFILLCLLGGLIGALISKAITYVTIRKS